MIYLAVPIKHPDPAVVARRISVANQVAARLHDAGVPVFSPASHSGEMVKHCVSPIRGWDYWSQIDLPILQCCCTRLAVLCLPGWRESEGVSAEIKAAQEIGIETVYIELCEWCGKRLDDAKEHHLWAHAVVPYLGALGIGEA